MLVIVVPAYNEAQCIAQTVSDWMPIAKKLRGYVLVVNDGSKDDTGKILDGLKKKDRRLLVLHQKNGGHGNAVMNGYRYALKQGATKIFQVDSDDQFSPYDFWKLWNAREVSPFITGHRKLRQDPLHRKLISKTARGLMMVLFGVRPIDPNIPFRLMDADYLKRMMKILPDNVFAPNLFLSLIALKARVNTLNIPVTHKERLTGKVSILGMKLMKVCIRSARELMEFRMALMNSPREIKQLRNPQSKQTKRRKAA